MSQRKLRVGIVGVGNCASSFVQGLTYYGEAEANEPVPGLMNVELGGYHVGDIEIVCRLRRQRRQGRPRRRRSDLRAAEQHAALRRRAADRRHGPSAARRSTGSASTCATRSRSRTSRRPMSPTSCERSRHRRARVLPAGRLAAGDRVLRRAGAGGRLRLRQLHPGVHRLGPDMARSASRSAGCRSSATTSRARSARPSSTACSTNLFRERGVRLDRTYQLNFGGNTDFQNMLERERLESKKISKTQAVTSQLDMPLAAERHPCRPERPRAVADRPQVGLHPHGGHHLRRRAAERRAEARSVGFARTPPASSSTPCAAPSWRWTAASAAR